MSKKILINFDANAVMNMIRQAYALNAKFSKKPNYLLSPHENGTWDIVGLADSTGGPHYYPYTTCPNCGQIEAMNVTANEDKQLYEIHCRHCNAFCNYVTIYTPLPHFIDALVERALASEQ